MLQRIPTTCALTGAPPMASSLFALLDDIATLLDDVALLTKIAAQKTAGVLGDDLALNAQQVSGVAADRELPVVWAVGKGSMVNKVILVPSALVLSLTLPWLITPLLMLGGAYLCFEGFEKLAHSFVHRKSDPDDLSEELMQALSDPSVDLVALEKDKIKGAIRTDFVLSAEIIAITLGTVQNSLWSTQLAVLAGVAFIMTVGVYGLVAGIVKIDDLGLYMSRLPVVAGGSRWKQTLGLWLLDMAPWLMKTLSVVGTAAMFLVGGGILSHGLPFVHHAVQLVSEAFVQGAGAAGAVLGPVVALSLDVLVGLAAGAIVLVLVIAAQKLLQAFKPSHGGQGL
jgi:predicted DNA repair protein MutK